MRVGDLLEICAAACLVAGIELYVATWAALLVAGACFYYLAQGYSGHPVTFAPTIRFLRKHAHVRRRKGDSE